MPEITEVVASYSRKVQLDDFEPVQHNVELTAELAEDDDAEDVYDGLADQAEDMVERAIAGRVTRKKLAESDDDE